MANNKSPQTEQLIPYQIKPKWKHLPTKAVRVPELLAEKLLTIARFLDEDKDNFLIDSNLLSRQIIEKLLPELSLNELKVIGEKTSELIVQQEEERQKIASHRIRLLKDENSQIKLALYAPFDPTGKLQRKAKEIANYHFNFGDKSWRYPLSSIAELLEFFPSTQYDWEEAALAEAKKINQLLLAAKVDQPLLNGWFLREYQKEAVKWLLTHIKGGLYPGGILADDMGLGKSIEALVSARAMQEINNCHVFIVCPVSLIENWQREAEKVGVKIEIFSNHYRKIPQPISSSYLIIADEAHAFQNPKSARTKKMNELIRTENCLAAWLLTGTPIKNGQPLNLFPLLEMCQHKLAIDKWHYFDRYCNARKRYMGNKTVWDLTGAAHLDELSKETEDVILRRTKKECLKELPPKTRLYKAIELEPKQQKEYKNKLNQLIADYRRRVKEGEVDDAAEALVTLNYIRKLNSEFKVDTAITLAQELLEQEQQVILFTEFVESAKALYEAMSKLANTELLIGETKDRQGAVDRFQSGESKLFIGTIKAGGVGITLTAASNVILLDRPWTPGDTEQAEDRAYRLGQKNAVFINWLQLGEIDLVIDRLIEDKNKRIELVLKGKRKTLRGIGSPKELATELLNIM